MMKKDVNLSQLATAVMWWLSYITAVGRNYILTEGAIRFPATEYLERSNIDDIKLEYGHPKLSMKRIDLYYKMNKDKNIAFEFKYIKSGSTRDKVEKQRIFNDLMRLYLFLDTDHRGYFLICGNRSDFVMDFQTILQKPKNTDGRLYIKPKDKSTLPKTIDPDGFYTEWFSFDLKDPEKEIELNTYKSDHQSIYDSFFEGYGEAYKTKTGKALLNPGKIKTKLVFLTGNMEQPNDVLQPSKIGIWEVIKT